MAKKGKLKAKDKREQKKQQNLEIYKANDAARQKEKQEEEERIRKEEEERKRKEAIAAIEKEMPETKTIKTSRVKAAGLKSAFYLGDDRDELLVTSFGRGPEACLEKRIKGNVITDIRENIEVSCPQEEAGKVFVVSGRHITDARRDNPLFFKNDPDIYGTDGVFKGDAEQNKTAAEQEKHIVGMDQIRLKSALEKRFFVDERNQPRTFSDNIHIQLIYNIMDIDKILAVQANNIIFAINNLFRSEENEYDDFIGESFPIYKTPEEKGYNESYEYKLNRFSKLKESKRLGYYGEELPEYLLKGIEGCKYKKEGKETKIDLNDKDTKEIYFRELYNVFRIISMVRNDLTHDGKNIFKLDGAKKINEKYIVLDRLYKNRVEALNNFFIEKGNRDIEILKGVYAGEDDDPKKLTKEYYEFVVLKRYKEFGISIKKLREILSTKDYAGTKGNKDYDTVRQKLNRAMDFIIYRFYRKDYEKKKAENEENESRVMKLIEQLRGARKDSEKEYYYREEAKKLWPNKEDREKDKEKEELEKKELWEAVGSKIEKIRDIMTGKYIDSLSNEVADATSIEEIKIGTEATYFSKLIYMMTLFLDGKEINDMLTQLINRFDNIGSFMDVMAEENIECRFRDEYRLFNMTAADPDEKSINAGKLISRELRVINSFARMSQPDPKVKPAMFLEAAELLGCDDNQVKSLAKSIGMPDTNIDLKTFSNYIFDKEKGPKKDEKLDNGFRNFIINNVIESDRFKYLVRYGNPKKLKELSKNKDVIDFVLKGIPDDQIVAYYNSCDGTDEKDNDGMRDRLAEIITKLSLNDFAEVNQGRTKDPVKNADKERKKAVIRLYLTMLYLLVKNLVYVNSRYFLAFYRQETDQNIYKKDRNIKNETESDAGDRRNMTMWYIEDYRSKFNPDEAVSKYEKKKRKEKERVTTYIRQNLNHSDPWAIRVYRNKVMHLAAIRNANSYINDIGTFNSYFELYHYLMQREIESQFEYDKKTKSKNSDRFIITDEELNRATHEYFANIREYHTYSKDFVKALNTPFAYNLARYKNLSINELFDRNNYKPTKESTVKPDKVCIDIEETQE